MTLRGRKILLAVCGSIAAYKSALIVRILKKQGAEVRVIMTPSALTFITPLTLSTLSENPVAHAFTEGDQGVWNNHVELALWADVMLIAPASENTIGKMASGICDNLVLSVYFSAKCPVYVCPAMDLDMYKHVTTQQNLVRLQQHGVRLIDAESGELASGLIGQGRLAEPENIVEIIEADFGTKAPLLHKKILITAGPTYEALDPVRFIGNHSSGKMGLALVKEAWKMGAEVTLVCGPVNEELLRMLPASVQLHKIVSGQQMFDVVQAEIEKQDVAIFAAAVADYTPEQVSDIKIKKAEDSFTIRLKKNPDIAKTCGEKKKDHQLFVGFALETNDEETHALKKLQSKNLDAIVLNSLNDTGAGFAGDTNKITIYAKDKEPFHSQLLSKEYIAKDILNYLLLL
ncbi:bifunctional phosphopantothenoylcysteine decarboxylase/phosphopantothenate--cysteine ligase CoaBC [Cytophaga hutchinsonii]|uniref:Coenzyme A biosynthesis bifunctional protein CoaBC n=1 Tax=Cytophaga hutchinsonii (strain ATCC 33406 / DSM 1761 / CIP 103989 / NBRC 15051 / NCIMB 9469 / D465) TaxID=269798 RepID=A0A6N4SV19_CYTH3|nr:bifunctional phosphopantothenoylcysteine decarboxylase/phosphopantothenate--cysteine ligase CoaBC [Cytophaga hutchinsonii]ABG60256.1 DNA/pantothenate metabolism flavoprotein [Cytophaga hutchinsonii ATCC 33406]SFX20658.1 phosphopantothenoylcysteine decarboxylase / phosphopantothenate--cysteine ligase [Cytophaga hutchinsonii ATCC 33406]